MGPNEYHQKTKEINESDKQILFNLLRDYIKYKHRFPTIRKFRQEGTIQNLFVTTLDEDLLDKLFKEYFIQTLEKGRTQTLKELYSEYKKNKDTFIKFFELNYKREITSEEFHIKGQEIVNLIRAIENRVLKSTENSQYKQFSSSTSEKFWKIIEGLFPYIKSVGVKIRKVD